VLNKCDLIHDDTMIESLLKELKELDLVPLRVSGAAALGLDALLVELFDAVDGAKRDDDRQGDERAN
jgi:50S ribosomal subunit-associated GTPase HflX